VTTRFNFAATCVASLLLATATPALSQSSESAQADAQTVLATVGDEEITLGHLIAVQENLPANYQELEDDVLYGVILEQLIQQSAIAQSLGDALPARALTGLENERRAFLANYALRGAALAAVTEEAVEALYAERYETAEAEQEYNAAHILVETEEAAQKLVTDLEGGADFAELAKTFSTGPSGPNGGALGWFGKGMMVAPFENAVLELEVGQVSAPVETQFGWHVIKLNETRETQAPTLDEVRAQLAAEIEEGAIREAIESLSAGVAVSQAEIEIDPALIRNSDLLDQ